jgi:putative ubiquitin-RnfH superfamily antitoxin RatB of RatAB toxin-antitoxin module
MAPADAMHIEVAYCPGPGVADVVALHMPAGSVVQDAVLASGLLQRHGLTAQDLRVGVWFKLREMATALRDRDRVEIYRPLVVDPKEARRQRYKRHKAKLPTAELPPARV